MLPLPGHSESIQSLALCLAGPLELPQATTTAPPRACTHPPLDSQVAARARRLGLGDADVVVLSEPCVEKILAEVAEARSRRKPLISID